jgi:hypothetical protein
LTHGTRLRKGRTWVCNAAYYLPAGMPGRIFDEAMQLPKSRFLARDEIMQSLFKNWELNYVQWVPSLVQHAGTKSILKHTGRRQTPTFRDPELDGYPDPQLLDTPQEICRKLKFAYREPPC